MTPKTPEDRERLRLYKREWERRRRGGVNLQRAAYLIAGWEAKRTLPPEELAAFRKEQRRLRNKRAYLKRTEGAA